MFFMVATFMHYLAMDLVHFCLRIATSAAISAPGLGVDSLVGSPRIREGVRGPLALVKGEAHIAPYGRGEAGTRAAHVLFPLRASFIC